MTDRVLFLVTLSAAPHWIAATTPPRSRSRPGSTSKDCERRSQLRCLCKGAYRAQRRAQNRVNRHVGSSFLSAAVWWKRVSTPSSLSGPRSGPGTLFSALATPLDASGTTSHMLTWRYGDMEIEKIEGVGTQQAAAALRSYTRYTGWSQSAPPVGPRPTLRRGVSVWRRATEAGVTDCTRCTTVQLATRSV